MQPPVDRDDAGLHGCPICTAPLGNIQPLIFIASPQGGCDQPPQCYGLGRGWHHLYFKLWGMGLVELILALWIRELEFIINHRNLHTKKYDC